MFYTVYGATITTGTILYTTSALTTPVANGFYSNGVDYWNTAANAGNLQNQTSCTPPTTTTTTTTAPTNYFYYGITPCGGGAEVDAYSTSDSLTGVFVVETYDCYTITSQGGGGTTPLGINLDLLTNVSLCSDSLCVNPGYTIDWDFSKQKLKAETSVYW